MSQTNQSRPSLKELMDTYEADAAKVESQSAVAMPGKIGASLDIVSSPAFIELVQLLQSEPILLQPTLNWVKQTIGLIHAKKLEILFSPEELQQLYEDAGIEKRTLS